MPTQTPNEKNNMKPKLEPTTTDENNVSNMESVPEKSLDTHEHSDEQSEETWPQYKRLVPNAEEQEILDKWKKKINVGGFTNEFYSAMSQAATRISDRGLLSETRWDKLKALSSIAMVVRSREYDQNFGPLQFIMRASIPRNGGWIKADFGKTDSMQAFKKLFKKETAGHYNMDIINKVIAEAKVFYDKRFDDPMIVEMNKQIEALKDESKGGLFSSAEKKHTSASLMAEEYLNNYISARFIGDPGTHYQATFKRYIEVQLNANPTLKK